MKAAIAKKIGMSHVYNEKGEHLPVTLLEVAENYVVSQKTVNENKKVVIGVKTRKHANKAIMGALKKAGIGEILTKFKEFTTSDLKHGSTQIPKENLKPGDKLGADQ